MPLGKLLPLALLLAASFGGGGCVYFPPGYPGPYDGPPPRYQRRPPYGPYRHPLPPGPEAGREALTPNRDSLDAPPLPPQELPIPKDKPSPTDVPRDQSQVESKGSASSVPTATRVPNRPTRVKSPFPPYGELDVTGLPSGSLAKDPVTGRIFKVP